MGRFIIPCGFTLIFVFCSCTSDFFKFQRKRFFVEFLLRYELRRKYVEKQGYFAVIFLCDPSKALILTFQKNILLLQETRNYSPATR